MKRRILYVILSAIMMTSTITGCNKAAKTSTEKSVSDKSTENTENNDKSEDGYNDEIFVSDVKAAVEAKLKYIKDNDMQSGYYQNTALSNDTEKQRRAFDEYAGILKDYDEYNIEDKDLDALCSRLCEDKQLQDKYLGMDISEDDYRSKIEAMQNMTYAVSDEMLVLYELKNDYGLKVDEAYEADFESWFGHEDEEYTEDYIKQYTADKAIVEALKAEQSEIKWKENDNKITAEIKNDTKYDSAELVIVTEFCEKDEKVIATAIRQKDDDEFNKMVSDAGVTVEDLQEYTKSFDIAAGDIAKVKIEIPKEADGYKSINTYLYAVCDYNQFYSD